MLQLTDLNEDCLGVLFSFMLDSPQPAYVDPVNGDLPYHGHRSLMRLASTCRAFRTFLYGSGHCNHLFSKMKVVTDYKELAAQKPHSTDIVDYLERIAPYVNELCLGFSEFFGSGTEEFAILNRYFGSLPEFPYVEALRLQHVPLTSDIISALGSRAPVVKHFYHGRSVYDDTLQTIGTTWSNLISIDLTFYFGRVPPLREFMSRQTDIVCCSFPNVGLEYSEDHEYTLDFEQIWLQTPDVSSRLKRFAGRSEFKPSYSNAIANCENLESLTFWLSSYPLIDDQDQPFFEKVFDPLKTLTNISHFSFTHKISVPEQYRDRYRYPVEKFRKFFISAEFHLSNVALAVKNEYPNDVRLDQLPIDATGIVQALIIRHKGLKVIKLRLQLDPSAFVLVSTLANLEVLDVALARKWNIEQTATLVAHLDPLRLRKLRSVRLTHALVDAATVANFEAKFPHAKWDVRPDPEDDRPPGRRR